MIVAVLSLTWLALSLPLGVLLGYVLRRAAVIDREEVDDGQVAQPAAEAPVAAPAKRPLPLPVPLG